MKESKKSKRKRSYSSSYSSQNSRNRSSSSSSERRHKRKHKSKKSKDHNKKHRSKSIQRQRSRNQTINQRNNYAQRDKHQKQDKYSQIKKQQPLSYKREDIKQSPQPHEQNPQAKPQKQMPCFEPSGILLQYYNAREGVSLRFHEPPQSRQPTQQWRMYIFKGEQVLQPIILTKSCYLIGKDERVSDILAQNPSISRQHAVIQFRLVQKRQTQGEFVEEIKPYVMDLESTNGTSLNDQKVQPGRYYELLHRDVLKFGFSDREYVLVKWEQNRSQEDQDQ